MQISMRYFKRENDYFYYDLGHGKKSLRTKDADEAEALFKIIKKKALEKKIAQLDKSKVRITYEDFQKVFFREKPDLSDKSVDNYECAFRLLSESIGNPLVSRITDKSVEKFKSDRRAQGASKVSVNGYLGHIRTLLNLAFELRFIEERIRVKLFKVKKRLPEIFPDKEMGKIEKYAREHDYKMWRIIRFAVYSGCRVGEIRNLTYQKIDGDMARVIGKGDKERVVMLHDRALEAIKPVKDIGYVFYRPVSANTVSKKFKAILRKVGIDDKRHFHNLRHTAATLMLANKFNLEEVQKQLGHEDIATTQIYAKVLNTTMRRKMKTKKEWKLG